MTRLAHTWIEAGGRTTLDSSPEEFAETMSYAPPGAREDLLERTATGWAAELQDVLKTLLAKDRRVLSIGSGLGEHEVPLRLEGYDVTASDIVVEPLERTAELFPELKVRRFDLLAPDEVEPFDDLLVTGLDYALDDIQLECAFRNARELLFAGGRLIWVHRFRDTAGTRAIDRVVLPMLSGLRGLKRRRSGEPALVRREHGYRRSESEMRAVGQRTGFALGRSLYAGEAAELMRLGVDARAPGAYRLARRLDQRGHQLTLCTVFELVAT